MSYNIDVKKEDYKAEITKQGGAFRIEIFRGRRCVKRATAMTEKQAKDKAKSLLTKAVQQDAEKYLEGVMKKVTIKIDL